MCALDLMTACVRATGLRLSQLHAVAAALVF